MSKVVITKDEQGKLCGVSAADQRAYARWRKRAVELEPGQTITFSFWLPRSPEHHAFFFLKLNRLLGQTEAFDDDVKLRHWLLMGAGHCDFVPGLDGTPNAIPKSMNFEKLDEAEFCELQRSVDQFLWTERAQSTLWPQLSPQQRWDCMDSFMKTFER